MSIYVIGDRNTVLGFRLAGTSGDIVTTKEEALARLDAALECEDLEILLITQDWAKLIRSRLEQLHITRLRPLILEVPDSEAATWEQPFAEFIRKAIGLSVSDVVSGTGG